MPYFQRDGDGVLCDACGFTKHHRPAGAGDQEGREFIENAWGQLWVWDPQGDWCWAPRWSANNDERCPQCRFRRVNRQLQPPYCVPIVDTLSWSGLTRADVVDASLTFTS